MKTAVSTKKMLFLLVFLLICGDPLVGFHPHFSPPQMLQRVREIDTILFLTPPASAKTKAILLEEKAQLLNGLERLGEASLTFEEALATFPKDGRLFYNYASILMLRELATQAIPLLERAIPLEPREVQYLVLLAQALEKTREHHKAMQIWLAAAGSEKDPGVKAEKFFAAANCAHRAGSQQQARKLLDQAVTTSKMDPHWLCERGRHLIRIGELKSGAADLATAITRSPGGGEIFLWQVERGEALAVAGDKKGAKAAFEGALLDINSQLADEPSFPEDLYFHQAKALLGLSRPTGAAKALEAALKILPGEPPYLQLGCRVFAVAGMKEEAAKCARGLAAHRKNQKQIDLEEGSWREKRARETLRQWQLGRWLGDLARDLAAHRDSTKTLAAIAKLGPDALIPMARLQIKWLLKDGKAAAALEKLGKLPKELSVEEPWIAWLRLQALKKLGRQSEGKKDRELLQSYLVKAKK